MTLSCYDIICFWILHENKFSVCDITGKNSSNSQLVLLRILSKNMLKSENNLLWCNAISCKQRKDMLKSLKILKKNSQRSKPFDAKPSSIQ